LLHAAIGIRGRLRLARGDLLRAIEDLTVARDRAAASYPRRVEPPWQPLLAEALVLAGREADAAAEVEAFAGAVMHWNTPRAHGRLARLRALLAPRDQAIALLTQAAEHFATAPLERARVLVELGARQGAAGERRTARTTLREAFDAAHACGATALEQRARDELRLVGGRPRTPAGGDLTPAERRVADLAAGGATNREIARRLFLSPKTIEMHLRSVYRKLGIAGREGLGPGSGTG
jgi:DNA-binding CsgD family transcriptional regulator